MPSQQIQMITNTRSQKNTCLITEMRWTVPMDKLSLPLLSSPDNNIIRS